MVDVSIIVPARDAAGSIGALLDALAAQDLASSAFEVVVTDDGSRDATGALAHAHAVVSRVIRTAGVGPGAARHAAVEVSRGRVLAFTDADCTPAPGWLRAGLAALAAGCGLVQGAVSRPPGVTPGPYDRLVEVGRLSMLFETANLFVTRADYDRVGGFTPGRRPRLSKELGEDVALGWRLVRAGAVPAFAPDAMVHHAVEPRGAAAFVAERLRLRHFPGVVRESPELRDVFLHRGVLLPPRSPLRPLPYARLVARDRRWYGRRRAAVGVAADLVGLGALVAGSVRSRALVL